MSYARTNNATEAIVCRDKIYAAGTFKNVYTGIYDKGDRNGECCVAKEFKIGSVFENDYFYQELNIIRQTQEIIDDFNNADIINREIHLNTPAIWEWSASGHKCLVEPMILNFEKFNSNSGWAPVTSTAWSDAMQALSHFSYHDSDGQFLLCDLQGGIYRDGYVLSDPVIMSQAQDCGPADLGPDGIRSFFQRHRCGLFCKRIWKKPAVIGKPVVPMRQGTSMVAVLPTRQSRNPMSRLQGGY